jgi:hypothetical protein
MRGFLLCWHQVVFTLAFAVEMVLKHIAYGCAGYWAENYNRFDGCIVLFSLVDLASKYFDVGINSSFLRALRLLRVFRIFRRLESLQRLLEIFVRMDVDTHCGSDPGLASRC